MLSKCNNEARLFKILLHLILQLSFSNLYVIMWKNNYGAADELKAAELNAGGVPQTLVENCCRIILITHKCTE